MFALTLTVQNSDGVSIGGRLRNARTPRHEHTSLFCRTVCPFAAACCENKNKNKKCQRVCCGAGTRRTYVRSDKTTSTTTSTSESTVVRRHTFICVVIPNICSMYKTNTTQHSTEFTFPMILLQNRMRVVRLHI